jgi:hypothetical protein
VSAAVDMVANMVDVVMEEDRTLFVVVGIAAFNSD